MDENAVVGQYEGQNVILLRRGLVLFTPPRGVFVDIRGQRAALREKLEHKYSPLRFLDPAVVMNVTLRSFQSVIKPELVSFAKSNLPTLVISGSGSSDLSRLLVHFAVAANIEVDDQTNGSPVGQYYEKLMCAKEHGLFPVA